MSESREIREIHEWCGCGASISVPITGTGSKAAMGLVESWRAGHRHSKDGGAPEHAPEVDVKAGARIESAGRARVGFTVDPNPGVRRRR